MSIKVLLTFKLSLSSGVTCLRQQLEIFNSQEQNNNQRHNTPEDIIWFCCHMYVRNARKEQPGRTLSSK